MGKLDINKKAKEDSLLATAYRLFTTKGVSKTSVSDIAESAGVAKGTFYLYFKDKYDLKNRLVAHQSSKLFRNALVKLNEQDKVTMIFTTHDRQDIEQTCKRIIIIDKGQLIAEGTVDELKSMIKKSEIIRIEAKGISDEDIEKIRKLDNVFGVDYDGKMLKIEAGNGNNVVKVITLLQEKGYRIKNVYSEQPTLNDVFLELTGKELRDD